MVRNQTEFTRFVSQALRCLCRPPVAMGKQKPQGNVNISGQVADRPSCARLSSTAWTRVSETLFASRRPGAWTPGGGGFSFSDLRPNARFRNPTPSGKVCGGRKPWQKCHCPTNHEPCVTFIGKCYIGGGAGSARKAGFAELFEQPSLFRCVSTAAV